MKAAFQGTNGAYSEVALNKYFQNVIEGTGYNTSEEVFDALKTHKVDYGFLPIENSIVGNVNVNLDLFYKYNFQIIDEVYLPIQHCLLAHPGTKLKEIKKVYSHPVALDQCRQFFIKYGIETIVDYDTAGSAKNLSKREEKDAASVASSLCAKYYNLDVVQTDIQQVKNNITRFCVFVDKDKVPSDLVKQKTSLIFSAGHGPGALLKCLEQFAKYDINLTKIESRPIPENPFAYVFHVDFLGNTDDDNIARCLQDLKKVTGMIKILGSYPIGKK
ncbi:MAG: prephenate dehydratase [Bacteriovoracaceae bacterium]|nr:prephenate dehydratase [Bacteriovoracaceae bacterium]